MKRPETNVSRQDETIATRRSELRTVPNPKWIAAFSPGLRRRRAEAAVWRAAKAEGTNYSGLPTARSETKPDSPARMPALPGSGAQGAGAFCRGLFLHLALLAAAALLTQAAFAGKPPSSQQASSGTLVLDLPYAYNWGLTIAASGTIYAVGNVVYGGWPDSRQVVLSSSDSGNSWSVLDDFAPPGYYVDFWGGLGGGI